jgi:hypothetical protein
MWCRHRRQHLQDSNRLRDLIEELAVGQRFTGECLGQLCGVAGVESKASICSPHAAADGGDAGAGSGPFRVYEQQQDGEGGDACQGSDGCHGNGVVAEQADHGRREPCDAELCGSEH